MLSVFISLIFFNWSHTHCESIIGHWLTIATGGLPVVDKRGDETENLSSQADINPTCAMLAAPCCSQQELLGGGEGVITMLKLSREARYTLTK